jgi:hypothetical protein
VDEADIEGLLAEAVRAYQLLPRGIGVPQIISAICDHTVVPLNDSAADLQLLEQVSCAARDLIGLSQKAPIKTTRLNELGNAVEEPMLEACIRAGLEASWPRRANGVAARTGYPDIAIGIEGERPTYLEAKVIGAGSEGSSFRSFYLSPSDNPKISVDARHLLVAFTHQRQGISPDGLEQYALISFKIVDLARVFGKIKFEYQASNRDMYIGESVVAQG